MSSNNNKKQNNYDIPYSNFDKPPIEDFDPNGKEPKKKKKTVLTIIVSVAIIILCVFLVILFAKIGKEKADKSNTKIDASNQNGIFFKNESFDYSSESIFFEDNSTEKDNGKAQSTIEDINKIVTNFRNDQISYDYAISQLNQYAMSEDETILAAHNDAVATINKLNIPRKLHSNGAKCLENGDYVGALENFNKISKDYYKYDEVAKLIERTKKEYKEYTFAEVDKQLNKYNFDAAMATLDELRKSVNDTEVSDKANEIINAQFSYDLNKWAEDFSDTIDEINESEKATMDSYKNEQKVFIQGEPQIKYANGENQLYVDVKNATDKTTKKITYSILEYDKNGEPIKLLNGKETYINETVIEHNVIINPESTFVMSNSFVYISLDNLDTKYVRACVKEVVFEDGTRWINPYYLYWVEFYNSSYQGL